MPVCGGCGGSYDDKFKFCPYCGRAKPEPETININITSDDVWETCEITLVHDIEKYTEGLGGKLGLGKKVWMFEATAIGIQGRYGAAWSETLKPSYWGNVAIASGIGDFHREYDNNSALAIVLHRNNCQPKLDDLIKRLAADGWQPIGRGEKWYSERFRRLVKKQK